MRRLLRPLPSILLVAACVATAAVTSAQTTTTDAPAGQSGNPHAGDATIQSGGVTRLKLKADGTVEGNTSALVGVFNVRHFGAKGDGKADDTAAVTNAIRARRWWAGARSTSRRAPIRPRAGSSSTSRSSSAATA